MSCNNAAGKRKYNNFKNCSAKMIVDISKKIDLVEDTRDKEILKLYFDGMSSRDIAGLQRFKSRSSRNVNGFISARTVNNIVVQYIPESMQVKKKTRTDLEIQKSRERNIQSKIKRELKWDTCNRCGSKENIQIDHRWPMELGGTSDIRNLEPLCYECHKLKTAYQREHVEEAKQYLLNFAGEL